MAFMFGAGVNGLFTGMSDALKLYSLYQNASITQAQIDAAGKAKDALNADLAQQNPAGTADQNIWGGGVNPNDGSDPNNQIQNTGTTAPAAAGPPQPKKPLDTVGPPPGTDAGTPTPATGAVSPAAPIATPSPASGTQAASGLQTPATTTPTSSPTSDPAGTQGATTQPAPTPATPPATAKKWADMTPAEREAALKQRGNAVTQAIGKAAEWARGGAPTQVGSGLGPSVTDLTGNPPGAQATPTPAQPTPAPGPAPGQPGAIGSGTSPLTGAATLPPGQSPTVDTAGLGPAPAPAPPAYNPYPGRPEQGPPQPGAVVQPGAAPPTLGGSSGAPAVPTPSSPQPQGVGGATPFPGRPQQGPPQPQAASLGSSILSAFNPVGSAQAAEPRPTLPPAATDTGPTPATPAPAAQPATPAPAARPAALAPAAQPAAPVPAKPAPATSPQADQPAPQQTGPTTTTAPVVPGGKQAGPSATSEAPPAVQAPEFDHRPYMLLQRDHPDEFAKLTQIAKEENANPAQLALLWHLESNMQPTSINSSKGAVGPLQILPSTARMVDPKGEQDINTLDGGLRVAARLLHMVIEPKFGVGTPSSFIAYQGGNGSADAASKMSWGEFQASHPDGAKYLADAYGKQALAQGMFTPDKDVDMKQFVDDGIAKGPDGALQALVSTGPPGMSMSNLWKQAETSGVYAALMRGDYQGAMAARDFVFQMSHAGATSNLMAADKALISGDGTSAAQYLAKAHAFFPDGTFGKFGVDKSGQVWGQRFDETTGKPLAQPFQVTHQGLATQLIETQDPNKYRELVNKEQQNAADLRLKSAHESYYYNQPDARTQAAALRSNTQLQIEGQREVARQQRDDQNNLVKLQIAGARADNTAKHEQAVEKEAHDLYTPDSSGTYRGLGDMPADQAPAAAGHVGEIYTAVRNSPQQDGGHLSSPFAQTLARTIAQGGQISFNPTKNKATGEDGPVEMVDKSGNRVGYLAPNQAQRLLGLGLIKVPQGQGGGPANPQAPGQRAAIGAGGGSAQVAMSGGGTNLANQPYQLPQQPQQQAIG